MVGVNIDVPQAQLVQLANDLLHGIFILVGHAIQGTCAGGGSGNLGVGEVHQTVVACGWDDLILLCGVEVRVSAETQSMHISMGFCSNKGLMLGCNEQQRG